MDDAISRSALERIVRQSFGLYYGDAQKFLRWLRKAPALDVAPVAQPKWISVKERLPEDGKRVLVYVDGSIAVSEVYSKNMINGTPMWAYTGLGADPEYWMPLPEPPKEEEK